MRIGSIIILYVLSLWRNPWLSLVEMNCRYWFFGKNITNKYMEFSFEELSRLVNVLLNFYLNTADTFNFK